MSKMEWVVMDIDKPKICNKYEVYNGCLKCAYRILTEFNLYSIQYKELYSLYKYLLTLATHTSNMLTLIFKAKTFKEKIEV
jgi:hypothetical protein